MGVFDHFPYTNFHELNLEWILNALKEIQTTTEQFVAINSLKYADPIQWNITSQYEKNTIVIDPQTGTAYISVAPVPVGVSLTNSDYWTVVFDLGSFVTKAAQNFTNNWEPETTLTATFNTAAGEWLVWGDTLYKALVNITAGDTYVVNSNIQHFTMEELTNNILNIIGDLTNLTTEDQSSIVNAINDIVVNLGYIRGASAYSNEYHNTEYSQSYGGGALFWWNGRLYRTLININAGDSIIEGTNCNIFTLELALTEISNGMSTLSGYIGSLPSLTTTDKTNLVNAINEINSILTAFKTEVGNLSDIIVTSPTDFADAINKCWSRTLAVEHRVDMYHVRSVQKAIIISDSYGESPSAYDNWMVNFENHVGITSTKLAYSGTGFCTNGVNSILTSFQAETIADKPSYTHIVCCCGANDICTMTDAQLADLATNIGDFVSYCRSNYPNAEVYIGFIGMVLHGSAYAGTFSNIRYKNIVATYIRATSQAGAKYLKGVELVLHNYGLLASDRLHPTTAGAYVLGYCVANAFLCGASDYISSGDFVVLDPITGATINGGSSAVSVGLNYITNEMTYWTPTRGIYLIFDTPTTLNDSYTKVASFHELHHLYGNDNELYIEFTAQAICDISPGNFIDIPFELRIYDGDIYLRSLYINSGVFEAHDYTNIFINLPTIAIPTMIN